MSETSPPVFGTAHLLVDRPGYPLLEVDVEVASTDTTATAVDRVSREAHRRLDVLADDARKAEAS